MLPSDLLPPEVAAADQEYDPLLDFSAQLEQSARILDLEDDVLQRVKHPEREITLNLPLRRDSGEAVTCTAYRVQHSTARGPSLGPVLFSAATHAAELRVLAARLSLQYALLDLPLGGAAGALVCAAEDLSERELRRLIDAYVAGLHPLLGPMSDVLSPDGGNEFTTAWMLDSYARSAGHAEPAAVVGKPAALGGLHEPASAIAEGIFALVEQALAQRRLALGGLRVAIQGFGAVAACLARRLHQAGARIVALADRSGGLLNQNGIDLHALQAHVAAQGVVFGFAEADAASNADVLDCDADLLLAMAAPRQIGGHNAECIAAPVIVEAVYDAVTPAAQRALAARGRTIIPDLLATSPVCLARYLEWRQGFQFSAPASADLQATIRNRMQEVWQTTWRESQRQNSDLCQAAYRFALAELAAAVRLR